MIHPPVKKTGSTPAASGFNIIELMAAMSLLVIITAIMVSLLSRTRDIWNSTGNRQQCVTNARNALDLMASDIEQSTIATNLHFVLSISTNAVENAPFEQSNLYFVRLGHRTGGFRPVTEINYSIEQETNSTGAVTGRNILARRLRRIPIYDPLSPAESRPLGPEALLRTPYEPVAKGVAGFSIGLPESSSNLFELVSEWDSRKDTPMQPPYLDIHIETLSRNDSYNAASLSGKQKSLFMERNKLRFSRRIVIDAYSSQNIYTDSEKELPHAP